MPRRTKQPKYTPTPPAARGFSAEDKKPEESTERNPIVKGWLDNADRIRGTQGAKTLSLLMRPDKIAETFFFDAPYQRGLVWNLEQKQRLINSILLGIQLPAVYLRDLGSSSPVWYEVIDGKQRLTTLIGFMQDEFPYEGLLFSQWDWISRRHWGSIVWPSVEVRDITDAQAEEIFNRLNFCGVPQSPRT